MPSAISVTSVMVSAPCEKRFRKCRRSEWKCVGEDTGGRTTTGERADEFEGVDLDVLAPDPLGEGAAGGSGEHELERLAVDGGPFGHVIGDQAAVVVGGELHR